MVASEASDGLLAKHKLLLEVIKTEWATRLDHKIAAVIIERYWAKYGCARASLRFLSSSTSAERSSVISSTRRLVDHGAFSVIREGKGTRPTEYALNFGFDASGSAHHTTSENDPSGRAGNTSCGSADATTRPASGSARTTETHLQEPAYKARLHVSEHSEFSAAPTAPPGPAAGAPAGAGTAEGERDNQLGGFEEFWSVYSRKHGRAKAKAAYTKIGPDPNLHAIIVAAAGKWADHYRQHGVEKKWQPEPANWLAGERWDEDLPIVHIDSKGAAIAKAKANAPSVRKTETAYDSAKPAAARGKLKGRHVAEVAFANFVKAEGEATVELGFRTTMGDEFTHRIVIESSDPEQQYAGQRELAKIVDAAEIDVLDDTSQFLSKVIVLTIDGHGQITYGPASPPDEYALRCRWGVEEDQAA